MINDDALVKYSIKQLENGFMPRQDCTNWVDYTRLLKNQIKFIREGFIGISDSDLFLLDPQKLEKGMRIIFDDNLDSNCGSCDTDHAAILGKVLHIINDAVIIRIDGIGQGFDFTRDPDRNLRWGDTLEIDLSRYHLLIQLLSAPKTDGGPVYYYYNKSTRDGRY